MISINPTAIAHRGFIPRLSASSQTQRDTAISNPKTTSMIIIILPSAIGLNRHHYIVYSRRKTLQRSAVSPMNSGAGDIGLGELIRLRLAPPDNALRAPDWPPASGTGRVQSIGACTAIPAPFRRRDHGAVPCLESAQNSLQ
jgi:hypothetical protein